MADQALQLAKTGDLASLKVQLNDSSPSEDNSVADTLVCASADAGQTDVFEWLIFERYPDYKPHVRTNLAALHGGAGVYEVFLRKWPHLLDWAIGHNGNAIGLAMHSNDMDLVQLLLSKGVDPNTACILSHTPLVEQPHPFRIIKLQNQILDLVMKHGFNISTEALEENSRGRNPTKSAKKAENQCMLI